MLKALVLFMCGVSLVLAGTAPTRLLTDTEFPMTEVARVASYQVAPDGESVLMRADIGDWGGQNQLYIQASNGAVGSHRIVSDPNVAFANVGVGTFQYTSDSRFAVFTATYSGVLWLYSARLRVLGNTVRRLNPLMVAGANVGNFLVTPDGSKVAMEAFTSSLDNGNAIKSIWRANVDGDGMAKTSVDLGVILTDASTQKTVHLLAVSNRGVLYSANPAATPNNASGVYPFFVYFHDWNVADNNVNTQLSPNGHPGQITPVFGSALISPNAAFACYLADEATQGTNELWFYQLYAMDGGSAVDTRRKINGGLVANGQVREFGISPDSNWIYYIADQTTAGTRDLYLVSSKDGATPTKINPALIAGGAVVNPIFSPDSKWILFTARTTADGSGANARYNLYKVATSDSPTVPTTALNAGLGDTQSVNTNSVQISSDSVWTVYQVADTSATVTDKLFSIKITVPEGETATNVDLTPIPAILPTINYKYIKQVTITTNSANVNVVMIASIPDPDAQQDNVISVPIGGGDTSQMNTQAISRSTDCVSLATSVNGQIYWRQDVAANSVFDLFRNELSAASGLAPLMGLMLVLLVAVWAF